jgi:hypothetical protein
MRSTWKWGLLPLVLTVIALGLSACHPAQTSGIWLNNSTLDDLLQSGEAWNEVNGDAPGSIPFQPVCNQDSNHDTRTLAKALVGVATGDEAMQFGAISSINAAVGSEDDCGSMGTGANRWLDVGRNVGAYVIAADVLRSVGVTSSTVNNWFTTINTRTLDENNSPHDPITLSDAAWNSGANASAQQGFVRTAIAAYQNNAATLANEFDRFLRYVGDRNALHDLTAPTGDQADWHQDPDTNPIGIVQAGATRNGCQWDGAIVWDMARIGAYDCDPAWVGDAQYSWVGLMGAVPAAVILERKGFHAFSAQNNALNRVLDFLWDKRQLSGDARWFDGQRANHAIWLANGAYCEDWLFDGPTGQGQTVGYVDWTHPHSC